MEGNSEENHTPISRKEVPPIAKPVINSSPQISASGEVAPSFAGNENWNSDEAKPITLDLFLAMESPQRSRGARLLQKGAKLASESPQITRSAIVNEYKSSSTLAGKQEYDEAKLVLRSGA